jgi:hypothetical protein
MTSCKYILIAKDTLFMYKMQLLKFRFEPKKMSVDFS